MLLPGLTMASTPTRPTTNAIHVGHTGLCLGGTICNNTIFTGSNFGCRDGERACLCQRRWLTGAIHAPSTRTISRNTGLRFVTRCTHRVGEVGRCVGQGSTRHPTIECLDVHRPRSRPARGHTIRPFSRRNFTVHSTILRFRRSIGVTAGSPRMLLIRRDRIGSCLRSSSGIAGCETGPRPNTVYVTISRLLVIVRMSTRVAVAHFVHRVPVRSCFLPRVHIARGPTTAPIALAIHRGRGRPTGRRPTGFGRGQNSIGSWIRVTNDGRSTRVDDTTGVWGRKCS